MNWQQQVNEPLYPNLLWSRPETKHGAGKLLIIGGQAQEFKDVAELYNHAERAGAGSIRVLMPDSVQKITSFLPHIEYAASNPSGSFASIALATLLDASAWADMVLIAGNLGKNSETVLLFERYIEKYNGPLCMYSAGLETIRAEQIMPLDNATLCCTFDELQKIGIQLQLERPLTSQIGNPEFADILSELTTNCNANLVTIRNQTIWSAIDGTITATHNRTSLLKATAHATVWAMQQPQKLQQAITTGVWCAS